MTLYDRIGGAPAVAEMVDEFYGLVLNDPELRPFFEDSSLAELKQMQSEFFAAALGGPLSASDLDLAAAHQGRGIQRKHFTRFVNHLIEVLERRDAMRSGDAMRIIFRIATFADDVIDSPGGEDG